MGRHKGPSVLTATTKTTRIITADQMNLPDMKTYWRAALIQK